MRARLKNRLIVDPFCWFLMRSLQIVVQEITVVGVKGGRREPHATKRATRVRAVDCMKLRKACLGKQGLGARPARSLGSLKMANGPIRAYLCSRSSGFALGLLLYFCRCETRLRVIAHSASSSLLAYVTDTFTFSKPRRTTFYVPRYI